MKTNYQTITIETETEYGEPSRRRFRLPADELRGSDCCYGNQVSTGIYETDFYVSPRGIVILRMYSCWDTGNGSRRGTYYIQETDPIRLAEEFGVEDVNALPVI